VGAIPLFYIFSKYELNKRYFPKMRNIRKFSDFTLRGGSVAAISGIGSAGMYVLLKVGNKKKE
jgi:hypothetical protein